MLKLMYITNRPEIAQIAESAGVDRIFVDMEYIGKDLRQGGMDTVQSHHTVADIRAIRAVVKRAEILVRCNPIHRASEAYTSSEEEIDVVVGPLSLFPFVPEENEPADSLIILYLSRPHPPHLPLVSSLL